MYAGGLPMIDLGSTIRERVDEAIKPYHELLAVFNKLARTGLSMQDELSVIHLLTAQFLLGASPETPTEAAKRILEGKGIKLTLPEK